MAEDKGQAAAAVDDEEPAFDAPERGSADELLDAGAHAPIDAMRHSTAHVMAEAVLELFPEAKLGIGPAIQNGFYYDFALPRPLTPGDLETIEERMRASVKADHAFVRKEVPRWAKMEVGRETTRSYMRRRRSMMTRLATFMPMYC